MSIRKTMRLLAIMDNLAANGLMKMYDYTEARTKLNDPNFVELLMPYYYEVYGKIEVE